MAGEVTALLNKNAVEEAPRTPGFYSRLCVVPKVTGDFARSSTSPSSITTSSPPSFKWRLCGRFWWLSAATTGISRSEGRLSTSPCPSSKLTVSPLRLGGTCAPVQCAVLRPVYSSSGVHQDHGSYFCRITQEGQPTPSVSRQLASSGSVSSRGARFYPGSASAVYPARDSHQSNQVLLAPSSRDGLLGSQHSDSSFEGFPDAESGGQPSPSSASYTRPPKSG